MTDHPASSLSRRQWLGVVSTPALAATVGAGILAGRVGAAELPPTNADRRLAGMPVYNIRDFGAKGDGSTLDTAALQAAIDACAKDGGGTVLVPAGTFVIGATELKSNITLYLAAQATLLGSGDGKQYHAIDAIPLRGDRTLADGNWGLLYAVNAKNITVEGPGLIDGQGELFNNYGKTTPPPAGIGGEQRPYHLLFHRCENIVVRDLRLVRCAFHSIRVIQSEHVRMEGLYIHNRVNINNDGFHFVSARHVFISNCTVLCQDDACALFGSCQFVTVTNCVFSTRWCVFRFAGGVVKNIAVSNCLIYDTYGCPIKIGAGQMQLENLSFSNIVMQNVTCPIGISFNAQGPVGGSSEPAATPPFVRNLSFSHIRATTVVRPIRNYSDMVTFGRINDGEDFSCLVLNAVGDARIENVSLTDVHVTSAGGGSAELAAKRNITQQTREYYTPWSDAPFGPPSYGLYARNVKGLTLQNVRFDVASADLRPAVVFDQVSDASIVGLTAQGNPDGESLLRFTATKDVLLSACRASAPTKAFLQLEGPANENITLDGGDVSKAARPVAFREGASEKAVRIRGV